jgi:hypothetical protein
VVTAFDQDALTAGLDLIRRSGATTIEFGYLDDDVPVEDARWWAKSMYRGATIMVEDERGPVQAVEALARRILTGAQCRRCGKPIQLSDDAEGCRWTRAGGKWEPGCGLPIDQTIPTVRRTL